MYGHNNTAFPLASDFQFPLPLQAPYDQLGTAAMVAAAPEFSNSCSSGCSSYGGSPSTPPHHHDDCGGPTATTLMIQRSVSSHSLQKSSGTHRLVSDLLELESGPAVRRVYSTGDLDLDLDLQRIHMSNNGVQMQLALQPLQQLHGYRSSSESSPLSSESSMIIEGMSKACRYSPEEKKEKIERYRSKRNLRNFNKTIKYACRKTLADSRPRIRGRFARNDEIEKITTSHVQWSHISGEEDEEDDDNWINLLDSFSPIESNSLI